VTIRGDLGQVLKEPRLSRRDPLLSAALVRALPNSDWSDQVVVTLPTGASLEADHWRRRMFGSSRRRLIGLMTLRDALVAPLRLHPVSQRGDALRFPVVSTSPSEVVVGLDDRHLDFRVSVEVCRPATGPVVVVTTVVRRHNLLGHIYFALIRGPHRVLVPLWTRRVVAGARRSTAGS
jgi:hypothetical protein